MKYLLALLMLFPSMGATQDYVTFDVNLASGALICDHYESVKTTIQTETLVSDCGAFQSRTFAPVTVTILEEFEYNGKVYKLAMYQFHSPTPWGNDVQFGHWGDEIPTQREDVKA